MSAGENLTRHIESCPSPCVICHRLYIEYLRAKLSERAA